MNDIGASFAALNISRSQNNYNTASHKGLQSNFSLPATNHLPADPSTNGPASEPLPSPTSETLSKTIKAEPRAKPQDDSKQATAQLDTTTPSIQPVSELKLPGSSLHRPTSQPNWSATLNLAVPPPPPQAALPTKAKEQTYRALDDFYSLSTDLLSLKKDDIVIIGEKNRNGKQGRLSISHCFVQTINKSTGWWFAKRGASSGLVPSSYLKEEILPPPQAGASESWAPSAHLKREALLPPQAASPTKVKEQIYRALDDFYSLSTDVLSLKKDDIVIIGEKNRNGKQGRLSISHCFVQTINKSTGWWFAKRGASSGLVPSAYLKEEIQTPVPSL